MMQIYGTKIHSWVNTPINYFSSGSTKYFFQHSQQQQQKKGVYALFSFFSYQSPTYTFHALSWSTLKKVWRILISKKVWIDLAITCHIVVRYLKAQPSDTPMQTLRDPSDGSIQFIEHLTNSNIIFLTSNKLECVHLLMIELEHLNFCFERTDIEHRTDLNIMFWTSNRLERVHL